MYGVISNQFLQNPILDIRLLESHTSAALARTRTNGCGVTLMASKPQGFFGKMHNGQVAQLSMVYSYRASR